MDKMAQQVNAPSGDMDESDDRAPAAAHHPSRIESDDDDE